MNSVPTPTEEPNAGPGPASATRVSRPRRSRTRRWDVVLVIAAGGSIGAAARYGLNTLWPASPGSFPWSTFTENVLGCLLIGALMVYLLEVLAPHRYARPFLGVGILGGFTTFSTYTADALGLVRAGAGPLALAYLSLTLVVAMTATWAGVIVARYAAAATHPRHRRRTS